MTAITDLDLYDILGATPDSTDKELVKAYRKKALKCHPDKNPDNPRAAELFHQLTKALEILTDAAAKAAYDKSLKAKQAAELRHKQLDGKRKKLKEDLEEKEKAASRQKEEKTVLRRNLEQEVERLRKEGSKLVEAEKARLEEELKKEVEEPVILLEEKPDIAAPRLKVKWKPGKDSANNGGYSKELLADAFSKYGEVAALLMSKNNGSAVVEFESSHAAILAVQHEIGIPKNPLKFKWISGQPADEKDDGQETTEHKDLNEPFQVPEAAGHDFESLVLMRMRQAEERKRLTEQLDDEETT